MIDKLKRWLTMLLIPLLLASAGLLFGTFVWAIYGLTDDACENPVMFFALVGFGIGAFGVALLSTVKKDES